jgi:hypothetical protein
VMNCLRSILQLLSNFAHPIYNQFPSNHILCSRVIYPKDRCSRKEILKLKVHWCVCLKIWVFGILLRSRLRMSSWRSQRLWNDSLFSCSRFHKHKETTRLAVASEFSGHFYC